MRRQILVSGRLHLRLSIILFAMMLGFVITPLFATPKATASLSAMSTDTDGKVTTQQRLTNETPLLNPKDYYDDQFDETFALSALQIFESGNGEGDIELRVNDQTMPINVERQGNTLYVKMLAAQVPKHLVGQHYANGSVINSVSAENRGANTLITVVMNQDFSYQSYRADDLMHLLITPRQIVEQPSSTIKKYTGKPISVNFQHVDVRSALHLLSQFTGINIVASDAVKGSLMLNLENVPWDQALDIILSSKNLGQQQQGNVILIAPLSEIAEQKVRALKEQQQSVTLLPLYNEYIRLNYAKAEDVLALIVKTSQSVNRQHNGLNTDNKHANQSQLPLQPNVSTLLSDRGVITADERTNTLIIKDTANNIANIRALINKIDIPVRQVMIEARIVSATDSFSEEIGVKWGVLSSGVATNDTLLVGGSDQTLADLKSFSVNTTTYHGQTVERPDYNVSRPDNLNVDLGIANPAGSIAFSLLRMSDLMIDLELSAMQAEGRGEVISTPKILTLDKQTAKVSSGSKIPYQSESEGGGTVTKFEEAVLSLEVTPNITPEGKISMQIHIENGRPNPVSNGVILIDTDTLSTNVTIDNGQTIVLGGIFRNQVFNNVEKVPFFGDLPVVGRLFKKDLQRNDKQELLIFITPKLINES